MTVITAGFKDMGRTAANLILSKKASQLRNPFKMIRRKALSKIAVKGTINNNETTDYVNGTIFSLYLLYTKEPYLGGDW
jgi:hypothetical protein